MPLQPRTPGCRVIRDTSENLRALMFDLCFDRLEKGLLEASAVLDPRFAGDTGGLGGLMHWGIHPRQKSEGDMGPHLRKTT